jgi:predicted nuclease with TOPRIM domain
MKKIIKQLEKSRDLLKDKFDTMDETFWDRSDKWQESDKGQDWEDKMNAIDSAIDELNSTIEDLETEFNIN